MCAQDTTIREVMLTFVFSPLLASKPNTRWLMMFEGAVASTVRDGGVACVGC
jgi:hypothetical protein